MDAWRGATRSSVPLGVVLACLLAAAPTPAAADADAVPLTLPEAVAIALRSNPAVAAAAGRESAAWSVADRLGADNWPQLRLDSRYAHVSEIPSTLGPGGVRVPLAEETTWVSTATLQQSLWTGGRASALQRQAGRSAEAAGGARARTRQLVVFGAERAFRLLLAAQEETAAAALNLAAAEDHLRVANSRLEARAAARFDVLRAEVAAEEARQEAIRAQSGLLAARAGLLQALGVPAGSWLAVAPERTAPPRPLLDELLAEAARRRPELGALGRQVEAAAAGLEAARAERWPTLGVGADYQYVTPESTTGFTRWTVGVFAALPLLDGGRSSARAGEAAAVLVQARAALESQRRQVEAEVRQSLARVESADAQIAVAAKRLEQAAELVRLAGVRYQGGVGTATEVADAQASLARARSGATRAAAEQGIAEAELALAVGATGEGAATGGVR